MPSYASLTPFLQRTLPWLTALIFLVLIIWQITPLFSQSSGQSLATAATQNAATDSQLQQILASEIFGVMTDAEAPVADTSQNTSAQISSLPYSLKGVISAATPSAGSAIIEISPGDSRYFSAGREISSNVKLLEVHSDHILVNNQGRQEILRLAELSLSMASATANPGREFGGTSNSVAPAATQQQNMIRETPESQSPDNTLDPEDVLNRDRIRQRLEELRARNPS